DVRAAVWRRRQIGLRRYHSFAAVARRGACRCRLFARQRLWCVLGGLARENLVGGLWSAFGVWLHWIFLVASCVLMKMPGARDYRGRWGYAGFLQRMARCGGYGFLFSYGALLHGGFLI